MKGLAYIASRNSKIIFVLVLLLTVPLAHFYERKTTHNTIDVFFENGNPDLAFYHRFQQVFGNDERTVIVFEDKDIFTAQNIEIIRRLSEMVKQTPGVHRVMSITEQNLPTGSEDTVYFEPLIPAGELTPDMLTRAKEKARTSELLHSLVLVSKDATMSAIIVELGSMRSNEEKGALQAKLMESAHEISGDRVRLLFTGVPVIENELNSLGKADNEKFGVITLLMVLVIVGLALRSLHLSLLCFANVVLVSIWSIGFYTAMGESMNLVTMMIPPVLIAITVAESSHFLSHYQILSKTNNSSRYDNVRETIRVLWLPCLLTTVTTVVGFLASASSSVRPVEIVGIYMAIGVVMVYLLTFTFLPSALLLFKKHAPSKRTEAHRHRSASDDLLVRLTVKLTAFVVARHNVIGIVALLLFVVMFAGITKIGYVTNFTNYMPEDNQVKKDLTYLDRKYGGTVPIELVIRAKSKEHDFTHSESLELIDQIQKDVMAHMSEAYTSSFSIANYFKSINKAFNGDSQQSYRIPDSDTDIADFYEIGEPQEIRSLVSPDKMEARISFQCINGPFDINVRLENFTNKYLPQQLGDAFNYKFTSYGRLYVDMDRNLRASQVNGLYFAFLLIPLIMLMIARDLRYTIIALIPNLFPIGMVLGIMGWLDIPFDVATIMVAAMTFGIVVDDTIHYTVWFRRNCLSGMDLPAAIMQTARDVGKPTIITSVVLFFGFAVMMFAQTLPLQNFGLLTALTMAFALIGDLVLLPALLLIFKPAIKPSTESVPTSGFA
jgi:predicted RND superfamily exporter protein